MEKQGAEEKAKKRYKAPALNSYGRFLDLTRMGGSGASPEGKSGMSGSGGKGGGKGKGM